MGGVPVKRVFFQPDPVIQPPLFQQKWTVVYQFVRLDPIVPVLFYGGEVHRKKGCEGTKVEKIRNRRLQLDAKCSIIDRLNSDLAELFERSLVERLRIFDVVKQVGIFRGGFRQ